MWRIRHHHDLDVEEVIVRNVLKSLLLHRHHRHLLLVAIVQILRTMTLMTTVDPSTSQPESCSHQAPSEVQALEPD